MNNPEFTSDLVYAVQNEDYQSELAVLKQLGHQAATRRARPLVQNDRGGACGIITR